MLSLGLSNVISLESVFYINDSPLHTLCRLCIPLSLNYRHPSGITSLCTWKLCHYFDCPPKIDVYIYCITVAPVVCKEISDGFKKDFD